MRLVRAPDEHDKFNAWYQPDDIQYFQQERDRVRKLVQEHGLVQVNAMDDVCCQGLEDYIDNKRFFQRKSRREQALDVVMATQQRHSATLSLQRFKESMIARQYIRVSIPCRIEAHAIALKYRDDIELEQPNEQELVQLVSTLHEQAAQHQQQRLVQEQQQQQAKQQIQQKTREVEERGAILAKHKRTRRRLRRINSCWSLSSKGSTASTRSSWSDQSYKYLKKKFSTKQISSKVRSILQLGS